MKKLDTVSTKLDIDKLSIEIKEKGKLGLSITFKGDLELSYVYCDIVQHLMYLYMGDECKEYKFFKNGFTNELVMIKLKGLGYNVFLHNNTDTNSISLDITSRGVKYRNINDFKDSVVVWLESLLVSDKMYMLIQDKVNLISNNVLSNGTKLSSYVKFNYWTNLITIEMLKDVYLKLNKDKTEKQFQVWYRGLRQRHGISLGTIKDIELFVQYICNSLNNKMFN